MGSNLRGFSVSGHSGFSQTEFCRGLASAELQAIGLVQLFLDHHYLTVEALQKELQDQTLPQVELGLVAAFLAGYAAAETYESMFDNVVFGEMAILDDKGHVILSALTALITLVNEKKITTLPNRTSKGQPSLAKLIAVRASAAQRERESEEEELLPESARVSRPGKKSTKTARKKRARRTGGQSGK